MGSTVICLKNDDIFHIIDQIQIQGYRCRSGHSHLEGTVSMFMSKNYLIRFRRFRTPTTFWKPQNQKKHAVVALSILNLKIGFRNEYREDQRRLLCCLIKSFFT